MTGGDSKSRQAVRTLMHRLPMAATMLLVPEFIHQPETSMDRGQRFSPSTGGLTRTIRSSAN